jgi:hypothetical protein
VSISERRLKQLAFSSAERVALVSSFVLYSGWSSMCVSGGIFVDIGDIGVGLVCNSTGCVGRLLCKDCGGMIGCVGIGFCERLEFMSCGLWRCGVALIGISFSYQMRLGCIRDLLSERCQREYVGHVESCAISLFREPEESGRRMECGSAAAA